MNVGILEGGGGGGFQSIPNVSHECKTAVYSVRVQLSSYPDHWRRNLTTFLCG